MFSWWKLDLNLDLLRWLKLEVSSPTCGFPDWVSSCLEGVLALCCVFLVFGEAFSVPEQSCYAWLTESLSLASANPPPAFLKRGRREENSWGKVPVMLPSTPSHHPSPISLHLSIFTSSSSTLTSSLFPLLPSLLSSSDKASLPPTPPPPLLVYVGRVYVLSPIITTSLPVLHPYSSRLFRNTCEGGVLSSTLFYLSARFQYIFSL